MDDIKKWQEEFRAYIGGLLLLRDDYRGIMEYIEEVPTVEPEPSTGKQEILDYLDTVLHPIISPEHWDVYSELHDMISTLPSSEPKLGKKDMPEQGDSAKFGVITGETCAYWDRESNFCALHRPSAQAEDWMERNKERILQAGMEGREIEFRIGGRLFAIREKAQ